MQLSSIWLAVTISIFIAEFLSNVCDKFDHFCCTM
jgi:hypothetical protein